MSDSKTPNILFLMDDQHRFDVAGFMGNPVVRTPTLDRLAADAVVFDNAYTPSPICVPGRQCIMSGQLPTTNGCRRYGDDLPPFYATFARQLSLAGYQTVCAGKLHHQGPDQMQGWTQRIGMDQHIEPEYLGEAAAARHHAHNRGKTISWDLRKELTMAGAGTNPFKVNDDYSVQGTLNFIRERFCGTWYDRVDHRPLLLKVSLQCPHYPFICTEEKFSYYINRVTPYPKREGIIDHPFAKDWTHSPAVSPREVRRALAAYYGMVEEVDGAFGTILAALAHAGQDLDDWIIVYTTDHGEMLGEFDTWWKLKFYEGSVRVPLFIRAPKRFGARRVAQNVSLCDLYATLCELGQAEIPDDRDSRSLRPLMDGNASAWPDTAVSVYMDHLMLKDGPWKYGHLAPDTEFLFNLTDDPHEEHNLAHEVVHRKRMEDFRVRRKELIHPPSGSNGIP
ncbi:MAG: sulfatase-like hydrolase/transferase [Opitutales bacterium]|nr:sulfatase-like hydrolase/transferase [Opitutales bacterium]